MLWERLPKLLEQFHPAVVIVELGGNDGLRGQPTKGLHTNLIAILSAIELAGATPLLLEVPLPPNYGNRYRAAFTHAFAAAAKHCRCRRLSLTAGVEHPERLMQADGIHPRAEMQPQILRNVWHALAPLL